MRRRLWRRRPASPTSRLRLRSVRDRDPKRPNPSPWPPRAAFSIPAWGIGWGVVWRVTGGHPRRMPGPGRYLPGERNQEIIMAEITAALVKALRERTGAGMMECKSALVESKGDLAEGEVVLRKRGIASAGKKASRATKQGLIGTYIHHGGQLGVMVEINCESDFVARTDDFQELVHDVAMHIAAADPRFIRKEDVTADVIEKEMEIQKARALAEGKPEKVIEKITEGRMAKFYEEICLLEQPFVKEATLTVGQLVKTKIAKLGENISVARFVRFKVGDSQAAESGSETAAAE